MKRFQFLLSFAVAVLLIVFSVTLTPRPVSAIPAFARQYNTSCATCHSDFPKLNDFGKAFKDAGFKFPSDDESYIKIPPVLLGSPAQKEMFPHTIWPGSIPGMPPIGLRYNHFFQTVSKNRGLYQYVPTGTTPAVPTFTPRTDFQSGLFSIFTAGNFGDGIAFWVDDDLSVAGENGNGGLGDGYLKFHNIGRVIHLPKDLLNLRVGQFELDLPFSQARSYNISPYDIYTQANIGNTNPAFLQQQFVNNAITMSDAMRGVEISGGHTYGGYHYSLAIVDQTTGGQQIENGPYVPSATGGNNGGLGFSSDANFKDIYSRFSYRFNLERNRTSRTGVQAAGASGPRDHTYIQVGTFYLYGRSVQRLIGTTASSTSVLLTVREPFYRVGGDFNFNYRKLNIFGLAMYGHDKNSVPVDASGTPIPLDMLATTLPVSFVGGAPAAFSGGFVQADYMAYPWMIVIVRYDAVNSTSDCNNGFELNTATNFFAPYNSTRNRFTPGVQFLIHANIKASFEYQIRPSQQILGGVDPITGATVNPPRFRTNTATAGLEFVY